MRAEAVLSTTLSNKECAHRNILKPRVRFSQIRTRQACELCSRHQKNARGKMSELRLSVIVRGSVERTYTSWLFQGELLMCLQARCIFSKMSRSTGNLKTVCKKTGALWNDSALLRNRWATHLQKISRRDDCWRVRKNMSAIRSTGEKQRSLFLHDAEDFWEDVGGSLVNFF